MAYRQGAHRGDYLVALQGEYRRNFWGRWGAVGDGDWGLYFRTGEAF